MTISTYRYGDPVRDRSGAHLWAHARHGCTVIAVRGVIDGANVEDVIAYALHHISSAPSIVLDLSAVSAATPNCIRLLRAVDHDCNDRGISWALVAGDAVRQRLTGRDGQLVVPMTDSVAHAEHAFDEETTARRRAVLPLLRRTA